MLTLTIKKKWYDMILGGVKTEEYRDIKPYYTSRFSKLFGISKETLLLMCDGEPCDLSVFGKKRVMIRNGYSVTSPSFIAKVSLSVGFGKSKWGAEKGRKYYILRIHEIKEETND